MPTGTLPVGMTWGRGNYSLPCVMLTDRVTIVTPAPCDISHTNGPYVWAYDKCHTGDRGVGVGIPHAPRGG